jgi:hypothetical protein
MNFRSAAFSVIFLVLCTPILAQSIIVSADINLPQDSIVRKQLISSLNSFLIQKEKANKENAFILKDALLETAMLTDEMRGMEKNIKLKDDNFYKCYLTNTVELTDDSYLVQLYYMSVVDKSPVLRAGFKLMAKQVGRNSIFIRL